MNSGHKCRALLLLFFFTLGVNGVFATTRYVATTGNDSANNCSNQSTPCKTIAHALKKAAPTGDTISVDTGTFAEHLVIQGFKDLTITGAGTKNTTIDGTFSGRVVKVVGESITISSLSIIDGTGTSGAGILNYGELVLDKVFVAFNSAGADGGGGIYNAATVKMTNSTVQANNAAGNGAGIYNIGTCNVIRSFFYVNNAIYGGGIYNGGHGGLGLANVVFKQNLANFDGAGVFNEVHARLLMKVGVFNKNTTTQGCCGGAGLFNDGTAAVSNVTFYGNSGYSGGGLFNDGHIVLTNTTFSGNSFTSGTGADIHSNPTTGKVTLKNTILDKGTSGNNCDGPITDGGYNLDSANSCGFTSAQHSLTNTNPKLQPLAANGGYAPSMALKSTSPAIDAADNSVCPTNDQRLIARPIDGDSDGTAVCDIGAYEYKP